MAGVYTDNQPDFSFLQPGETKTWSQFLYPIQKIGPARHANLRAAVSLGIENNKIRLGISPTQNFPHAVIEMFANGRPFADFTHNLAPGKPFVEQIGLPENIRETNLAVRVANRAGGEIIFYQPKQCVKGQVPSPATEPPAPGKICSADELFVTGLHLDQYRHATRCPTLYWREALCRDPLDWRCNNAMGLWHLRRGEFVPAEKHFCQAIGRLTQCNSNPYDGEAYYNLGLCLRYQLDVLANPRSPIRTRDFNNAYAAFYKATWNQAWAAAGFLALAEMDCSRGDWINALDHLNHSLRYDTNNLRARDLKAVVLQKLNRRDGAEKLLRETLALDPLDWWARLLLGEVVADGHHCDAQTLLDIVHDFARAGFYNEAIKLLEKSSIKTCDLPDQNWGVTPLIDYTLGWLHEKLDNQKSALDFYRRAAAKSPDYCFPARLRWI